jgi:prophage antirepressor-like protein
LIRTEPFEEELAMGYTTFEFHGAPLRVLARDGTLLFNAKDICTILDVRERPSGSDLAADCMDFTTACNLAGSKDSPLVDWLLERFHSHPAETLVHPTTDSEWTHLL